MVWNADFTFDSVVGEKFKRMEGVEKIIHISSDPAMSKMSIKFLS